MKFYSRLIRNCLHSDGEREYVFMDPFPWERFFSYLEKELPSSFSLEVKKKKIGDKVFIRFLVSSLFKGFFWKGGEKIRVEFLPRHPPYARKFLEEILDRL